MCEIKHELGQLVDTVVDALQSAVDDVDAVVLGVLDQLLHVAAESRKVGGDRRHTHDGALGGSVTPGFVVRAEDTHVRTTNEVIVVDGKDRVGGAQELGVEDDLYAIRGLIEKLATSDLVENGVLGVVVHVVCDDRRQGVALHSEEAAAKHDLVLGRQKVLVIWRWLTLPPCKRLFEELLANVALNVSNGVVQALDHSLALQCLHSERCRLGRHNNESHDGHIRAGGLHAVVQTGQRLDEHVHTLISVLVATSGEEV